MPKEEKDFLENFEKYSDKLFRHAMLRLSNRERALEIVQDCFMKTWDYVRKGNEIKQYSAFLYRTLNNMIIDEYRKHKTYSLDALMENEETAPAMEAKLLQSEEDIIEKASVNSEAKEILEKVDLLPDHYKTVVLLRYMEDLSPGEIAERLNERESTVSVRIHRGVRKLRELISSSKDIKQ